MRYYYSVYSILLSFSILIQIPVLAQHDHIRFERLTINDGLSLSSVYSIYQDSKGFMWFGTEDGLNKYDGKRFQIFRPEPGNASSLAYKWTELIYEDSKEQLWFGSKGGLTQFNPENEKFTRYHSKDARNQMVGDAISCLAEDKNKKLWVGTSSGMNMIDLETNQIVLAALQGLNIYHIIPVEGGELWVGTNQGIFVKPKEEKVFREFAIDPNQKELHAVFSIVEDANGAIWFGAGNSLFRYNPENKVLENVLSLSDLGIEAELIEKLLFDDYQNLWVSASNGLYLYSLEDGKIVQLIKSIDTSNSLAVSSAKPIHRDRQGILWYGTFDEGIYRINTKTRKYINVRNNPTDAQSLSENAINCIYEDRAGKIWLGTFGAGINMYNPHGHKFGFISHDPLNKSSLSSNFIWNMWECDKGYIWIGTNDQGLNKFDPLTGKFEFYNHNPKDPTSISHSSVRKVYQDSKQRIWIGTDGGGLNRYYPKTGIFTHYKNKYDDSTSISGNSVRVIYEDRENRLWVGTRSGLNLFDPENETFTRFVRNDLDANSISHDFVYSAIYQDRSGNLWVGTYGGGLNKLDIESGKFSSFLYDPENAESLSDNIVFSIYEDEKGILWIGTNSGLNRFDQETEKFQRFGINEGLPNEVIYGILADDNNRLWLSTNKGICRFDPRNFRVKNFTVSDGLQSNEFNGGAFHKGRSGQLYFGGVYGLNIIDPNLNYIDENKSQMVITSLEILGQEVKTLDDTSGTFSGNRIKKFGNDYLLPKSISYSDKIVLDYKYRFFSIEYAALNSSKADNERFYYTMKGLDDKWNDVGSRNFITFANMQPGKYTLMLRSENADGIHGISSEELEIVIIPPFWKTWWFYTFQVLVVLLLFRFLYRYLLKVRTNRLLRIQNEKINHANQKLTESENNLKQLNITKDKFFSIIAHDLKNPFSSLLSVSDLMSKDYKMLDEEEKEQGIKIVNDSAKRIYKLLENLLTWSMAQTGKLKYEPMKFELKDIIKENLLLHKNLAKEKGVFLEYILPKETGAFGDKEMINTVIRNLLSNAIKFTPSGKSVELIVDSLDTFWEIRIVDEGIGISSKNQDKIFQVGRKFKTDGTAGEKGTGLGLIICKEFVHKNGGHIVLISEEGKGSTFSFTLPRS